MNIPTRKAIVNYYDFSKFDYQLYNLAFSNISMHFGLWDETTKNHRQALLNENKILAELSNITANDYVIDLGCGYGTTAIWLAKNIGCHVVGITISKKQVLEAKEVANQYKVSHLVEFLVMDYHKTNFKNNSFDVAIAIESIAHSAQKQVVIKEIHRILKPNGRLIIADGYFAKNTKKLSLREQEIAKICFEGVHVPPLPEKQEFENWLKKNGFIEIKWIDKTKNILRISKKISSFAKWILPISKILRVLGSRSLDTSHVKAFISQYYAWRDGLGIYGIFCAVKQRRVKKEVQEHKKWQNRNLKEILHISSESGTFS